MGGLQALAQRKRMAKRRKNGRRRAAVSYQTGVSGALYVESHLPRIIVNIHFGEEGGDTTNYPLILNCLKSG